MEPVVAETFKNATNDFSTALFPMKTSRWCLWETKVAKVPNFTSRQGDRDHSINNGLHPNLF